MQEFLRTDPIIALSTGAQNKAAIGILRITGIGDISFLKNFLGLKKIKPRYAHFIKISDGDEIYDEGLLLYFPAPYSFTGENIIEFHLHGNPFNLERIISFFIKKFNFKLAYPGEFTYRALRNKKMNLTQVEGLDLLLNSTSAFGLSAATKALNNELYTEYLNLRSLYIDLRSAIELAIDFSDDMGEEEAFEYIREKFSSFSKFISSLVNRAQGDLNALLVPRVVLFGKTNAGKSTLFNFLVGQDRSIVSDVHGTTRDFISEYIYIDSQAFQLVDTAGLRSSGDYVEREGIRRSLQLIDSSFFKIFLLDIRELREGDLSLEEIPDLIILTHSDFIDSFEEAEKILKKIKKSRVPLFISAPIGAKTFFGPIGPNGECGPIGAKEKEFTSKGPVFFYNGPIGAPFLRGPIGPQTKISTVISERYRFLFRGNPIPIARHRSLILEIGENLEDLASFVINEKDLGITSHKVSSISSLIDELIGITGPDDILENIFSNFCIGK